MIPCVYDLILRRGVTFEGLVVNCFDDDGDAVDLTGCTVFAVVRKTNEDTSPLLLDLQPVVSDAATGEVTIPEIADEDTLALPPGGYVYDLVIEDAAGKRTGPYLSGRFQIERMVTHA